MSNCKKDTYLTIARPSEGLYKEKGSKFIAYAFEVRDENDVKRQLEEIRRQHPQARHVCYAYRLGISGETYRYNDDGEPSGTAGKPIFGQLLSFNVTYILIAVVRYFGGTKLGVGGLIAAYKEAAKDALLSANIVEKIVTRTIDFTFDYAKMNDVMRFLKQHQLDFEQYFDETPRIVAHIRLCDAEQITAKLANIESIKISSNK